MSTSPRNDSHCPKLCCLSCTLITNSPWNYPFLVVLKPVKPHWAEIQNFFTGLCMCTPIHVFCFKSNQNRCRIGGRQSTLYWWQKKTKHVLASLGGTPGANSPNFLCECALWPLTYIQVSSRSIQAWGIYNRKASLWPQSKCNTWLFKPITNEWVKEKIIVQFNVPFNTLQVTSKTIYPANFLTTASKPNLTTTMLQQKNVNNSYVKY